MIVECSPAYQGTIGIHTEWNARNLRVIKFGERQMALVTLRDDGPDRDGQRHPDIECAIPFDTNTDWQWQRLQVWRALEEFKKHNWN